MATGRLKGRHLTWITAKIDRKRKRKAEEDGNSRAESRFKYDVNAWNVKFVERPCDISGLEYGEKVIAPDKTGVPSWSKKDEIRHEACEFFSGSGRLSEAFDKITSLKSTRVDWSITEDLDNGSWHVSADIASMQTFYLKHLMSVAYIHLSPTCSTYSNLASSVHRREWENNYLGVTTAAHEANGLILRLFNALRNRQRQASEPAIITIENPDATFHLSPVGRLMQKPISEGGLGLTLLNLSFCAFGEPFRKNSIFLTNSRCMIALFSDNRFRCDASKEMGCSFSAKVHVPISGRFGTGCDTDEATPFPFQLCFAIANCVRSDLTSKGCENSHCIFDDKHKHTCSHVMHPKRRVICGPARANA